MAPRFSTNVSPAQIIKGGELFSDAEGEGREILADMDYRIAALNNPWGEDDPGTEFFTGTWAPAIASTHEVVDAFDQAMGGISDNVKMTGLGYAASNVASEQNVGDIHVT